MSFQQHRLIADLCAFFEKYTHELEQQVIASSDPAEIAKLSDRVIEIWSLAEGIRDMFVAPYMTHR